LSVFNKTLQKRWVLANDDAEITEEVTDAMKVKADEYESALNDIKSLLAPE
jgi:hypothetical protein